jgi:hypothetical protein
MSEEPIAPLLPEPLNEDGGEGREVDFSELDRDLLPALEEQEKPLSATSPNSLYLPHCYTEPSRAQIGQGYEQGATSQGRLEGLRDDSELCNQDHGEEKRSEQQQPEGGGGSRRGNEGRGGQKDDNAERDQWGEEQRHWEQAEEICSRIHRTESSYDSGDTNSQEEDKDQDEQDPQPASSLRAETAESQGPLSGTSESGGDTHGKAAVLFYIRISCIAVE